MERERTLKDWEMVRRMCSEIAKMSVWIREFSGLYPKVTLWAGQSPEYGHRTGLGGRCEGILKSITQNGKSNAQSSASYWYRASIRVRIVNSYLTYVLFQHVRMSRHVRSTHNPFPKDTSVSTRESHRFALHVLLPRRRFFLGRQCAHYFSPLIGTIRTAIQINLTTPYLINKHVH